MIASDKSLKKICKLYHLVENYIEARFDKENKWELHHRREIDEMKSRKQLIDEDRYFDVEPDELIFLTKSAHEKLHNTGDRNPMFGTKGKTTGFLGKFHSESSKAMLSKYASERIGDKNPFYGKTHSTKTRKQISEDHKGRHWYNNGVENKFCYECPPGFVEGMLIHKRQKNKGLEVLF